MAQKITRESTGVAQQSNFRQQLVGRGAVVIAAEEVFFAGGGDGAEHIDGDAAAGAALHSVDGLDLFGVLDSVRLFRVVKDAVHGAAAGDVQRFRQGILQKTQKGVENRNVVVAVVVAEVERPIFDALLAARDVIVVLRSFGKCVCRALMFEHSRTSILSVK